MRGSLLHPIGARGARRKRGGHRGDAAPSVEAAIAAQSEVAITPLGAAAIVLRRKAAIAPSGASAIAPQSEAATGPVDAAVSPLQSEAATAPAGSATDAVSKFAALDDVAQRVREAGGPTDRASYACSCGYLFAAPVSTTVECPHCGTAQAW
jgi:hypothetical protein